MAIDPTQFMRIRGSLVEHIEERVLRSTTLAQLIPQIAKPAPYTMPRLPKGTVLFYHDPPANQITVVVERDPFITSLATIGQRVPLRIAVPFTYFVFRCQGGTRNTEWVLQTYLAYWAKERLTTWESPVITPRLPNISRGGRICFGTTPTTGGVPLHTKVDTIINGFYQSDYSDHLGWHKPDKYRSYAEWAIDTRANPLCWMEWSEWNQVSPLNSLAGMTHTTADIQVTGTIPRWEPGPTFGRAAQWFRELPATDRYRLVEGIRAELPNIGLAIPSEMNFEAEDLAKYEVLATKDTPHIPVPDTSPIPDDEDNFNTNTQDHEPIIDRVVDRGPGLNNFACECDICFCPNTANGEAEWCVACDDGNHEGTDR